MHALRALASAAADMIHDLQPRVIIVAPLMSLFGSAIPGAAMSVRLVKRTDPLIANKSVYLHFHPLTTKFSDT